MASLADIRKKLQEQEASKTKAREGFQSDNGSFPIWKIPEDSTTVIRLLPDGDSENDFFWKERLMIKLPFAGVKGQDKTKQVTVTVPCMAMFGKTCPITEEIRDWWKGDEDQKKLARTYYRKASYLYHGFVVSTALVEQNAIENPIRRFIFSSSIHNKVKAALMDPEFESMPTDFENGLDFKVTKTTKAGYADYDQSSWARRERPLSEEEAAAIEKHGLPKLSQFLPKEPSEEAQAAIFEMFEASVGGDLYDTDRWGKFYRPYGVSAGPENTAGDDTAMDEAQVAEKATVKEPAPAPVTEVKMATSVPAAKTETPAATSTGSKSVNSVLEALKAKQQAKNNK